MNGKARPRAQALPAPPKDDQTPAKPADPPGAFKAAPLPVVQPPKDEKESFSEKIKRFLGRKKKK